MAVPADGAFSCIWKDWDLSLGVSSEDGVRLFDLAADDITTLSGRTLARLPQGRAGRSVREFAQAAQE